MAKFETPTIEIAKFGIVNVITTSGLAGNQYETDRDYD